MPAIYRNRYYKFKLMKKKSFMTQTHRLLFSDNMSSYIIQGIAAIITGLLFGSVIGDLLITGLITKGNRTAFLLYRPSAEYIYTAKLLGSNSELLRLSGYYSLLDNRQIDSDFLIERYRKEPDYIKRSIIWVLGFAENPEAALAFFTKEYKNASKILKREMLRAMKRIDKSYYTKFIIKNKINKEFTRD